MLTRFYISPAKVVTDRVSGYSKGFGFVKYATTEEATVGKQGMHGEVCKQFWSNKFTYGVYGFLY